MIIKVKIKGVTPLLMAKFSEGDLSQKKVNKNLSPEEMAEKYAYRNENDELYIPGICIFSAIIEGGKFSKRGKSRVTTLKSSLIPAGVTLLEKECLLGTKTYEIDKRSTVVPATGGRIMTYRPVFENWEVSFTLEVDEEEFSAAEVKTFVKDTGIKCGILAFRPSRKGWFGKFEIVEWNIKNKGIK